MRPETVLNSASALLFLAVAIHAKRGVHEHLELLHRRHRENRARGIEDNGTKEIAIDIEKRGGQCQFPTDAGLVAITPGSTNGGWAMSPDQSCTPGTYCPYACPPGQVSMQWDPTATSYTYPQSMNGGLYCNSSGQISKPFPDKPYCQSTSSNVGVVNTAGDTVAFCQTVLPGNEAMLIPTHVGSSATLANPGTDYWCGTAAHYYINPPGTSTAEACVWGTNANPLGNWSPYVAGTNVDSTGLTFVKLGWNPIYLESGTPFRNTMPNWGVKIDCPNGGCTGLPCSIDMSSNKVNQMLGSSSAGVGGGAFCVVTVSKGATANFVVYSGSGSSSSSSSSSSGSTSGTSSIIASSVSSASSSTTVTGSTSSRATSSSVGTTSNSGSSTSSSGSSTVSTSSRSSSGKGGQFYASSAASSSTTSTSTTTTSTKTTTTTTTTASTSSEVFESTTTTTNQGQFSSSTTSTVYSSSKTTGSSQSFVQPYYALFNSTLPSSVAETGAVTTGPTTTVDASASATAAANHVKGPTSSGGASQLSMGAAGLAIAFWSLLL